MIFYKICGQCEWADAVDAGVYHGSSVDHADGFIHLSTEAQLEGTLAKHFAGQEDLVLVAFESDALGETLRMEPSRGGALFPHVYGTLDPRAALFVRSARAP